MARNHAAEYLPARWLGIRIGCFGVRPLTATGWAPDGWAEVVAWCEPAPGGVRLSISLVEGVFHALLVRGAITELIEQCRQDGSLITAGEAMSGLDLPLDSPGRPTRHGGRL